MAYRRAKDGLLQAGCPMFSMITSEYFFAFHPSSVILRRKMLILNIMQHDRQRGLSVRALVTVASSYLSCHTPMRHPENTGNVKRLWLLALDAAS